MPYARRTDQNLSAILREARRLGFLAYARNDMLGDIDVQLGGIHEVWEVKSPTGRPTKAQERFRAEGWAIPTIRTAEDVLARRKAILKGWAGKWDLYR